jgi:transcriptional regulator with XRE-family HTH domain
MGKPTFQETQFIMTTNEWPEENTMNKLRGVATRKGMESIAQRVARIRQERGITQEEMARLLGVSQPIVSDYERGELRLHGELIVQLTKILEVTADEILGLEPTKGNNSGKNRRLLRRIQHVDRLSKRDQDALLRTIDAFLAKAS